MAGKSATATVTAEDTPRCYVIRRIHLDVAANISPRNLSALQKAAERARQSSPVCCALKVPVTVAAELVPIAAAGGG